MSSPLVTVVLPIVGGNPGESRQLAGIGIQDQPSLGALLVSPLSIDGSLVIQANAAAANLDDLSSNAALLVASPGCWAIQHQPAAATQATISRAAVANTRHVCRSVAVSLVATGAQTVVRFNLRDGASGAGTILWSVALALAGAGCANVVLGGLDVVGSLNTAMTLESGIAPAAGNFAAVSLTGYDAS